MPRLQSDALRVRKSEVSMSARKGDKHPNMIGNKYAVGHGYGRATTFKAEYVSKPQEYLEWCDANPLEIDEGGGRIRKSPRLPSMAGFSRFLEIPKSTLLGWAKGDTEAHKDFSSGLESVANEQEKILYELGRAGEGNSRFAQFILSADHNKREKSETDLTSGGEKLTAVINVISPDA